MYQPQEPDSQAITVQFLGFLARWNNQGTKPLDMEMVALPWFLD